jgi:predicted nuclease of predicted toxin-antitoxin system
VKLLFDENLSRKLVFRLAELFPNSAHVVEFDLLESPDRDIWDLAKAEDFVIVSTDSDFYELATTIGPPPKVVWLRRWTHPTVDAERILRREAIRIMEFSADPEFGVLVLDRD